MGQNSILIVEDDLDILSLLSLALERNGFLVSKATSYLQALKEITNKKNFDIILMDYYLPEVDGISLSQTIDRKGIKVPIILFTAADIDNINISLPSNIVDIIKKPFNVDEIIQKLKKTIKMKQFFLDKQNDALAISENPITKEALSDIVYTEKAESLRSLLSKLSHEIKNALQTISTNVELLENGYIEKHERARCFNAIKKKIDDIKNDIDILKHPQEFYEEKRFSLKNCLRDTIKQLKNEIKQKDVYIKTDYQKSLPFYRGKRGIFNVMMKDLFSFLLDCIPYHGKLEISLTNHQQEYFLEVIQNSIINECKSSFEVFDMNYGNGIGLTRVVLNLKEMNGKINVSLLDSGGLHIKIIFPMH